MLEKIDLSQKVDKKTYKHLMPELTNRLYLVQKASWDAGIPVVILFEGWDAAGKGTSIQKLTSPLDPRGFKLYPIRAARTYEKKRPWLWRFWLKLPARGEWAIFDRSWYGRVMVERVEDLIPENEWRRAYRDIVDFERTIADDGTLIIKFFLHISKPEQRKRFEKLSKDPLNAWHVSAEDWEHHRRYEEWTKAYEEAFEQTDTEWGPWTIVEATDRRHTWVKIYQTIINALEERLGMEHMVLPAAEEEGEGAAVGEEAENPEDEWEGTGTQEEEGDEAEEALEAELQAALYEENVAPGTEELFIEEPQANLPEEIVLEITVEPVKVADTKDNAKASDEPEWALEELLSPLNSSQPESPDPDTNPEPPHE